MLPCVSVCCEYVAKYNIGGAETGSSSASWKMTGFRYTDNDLPYTTYTNCSGSWDTISAQERREGKDSRGEVRPAWELVNRLAQDYGKSSIYAKMWVDKMPMVGQVIMDLIAAVMTN